MKTLFSLLVALLFAAPLSAEQALILTEIEQLQEKIWYLQRDLAAQKSTIEKQQQAFSRLAAKTDKQQSDLETHSATTAETLASQQESLASQQESLQRLDATVQSLKESVTTLVNEFNQQNSAQRQQAEKAGAQEGLIRAMREEFAANRKQTEQALAETQKQLAETRAELAALQTDESGQFNQLILWGGGIALGLSILLTIVLAFRSGRSRQTVDKREFPTKHEL